ncbi:uncharacterized protein DMENIID0001_121540 [Sergentomyia squamirostris]
MSKPKGYEYIVECPYNKSHQIENGRRLQTHLIKCRKEYEKLFTCKKVQCPFNASHMVNEPEKLHHLETCPDRVIVDKFNNPIVDSVTAALKTDAVKMIPGNQMNDEEDWDDEPPTAAYNPQKYCEENNVLRLGRGMQPHERKAFRNQEHFRLGNLRETQ